jgi:hypothetical protein
MTENPLSEDNQETWQKYLDEETKQYYWYNQVTGESRWVENNDVDDIDLRIDDTEKASEIDPFIRDNQQDDNDDTKTLIGLEVRRKREVFTSDEISYWRFMYVNAIIFESPLCVLESYLRIAFLIITILCMVAFRLCLRRNLNKIRESILTILKDIMFTFAASLSFLLPGLILYIYKGFHPRDDWNLRPLPTIIGRVDCRRYFTIVLFGSGYFARNNVSTLSNSSHQEDLDVWSNSIYCFPMDVYFRIAKRPDEKLKKSRDNSKQFPT